jgi:hypothetical protein
MEILEMARRPGSASRFAKSWGLRVVIRSNNISFKSI